LFDYQNTFSLAEFHKISALEENGLTTQDHKRVMSLLYIKLVPWSCKKGKKKLASQVTKQFQSNFKHFFPLDYSIYKTLKTPKLSLFPSKLPIKGFYLTNS